MTQLHLPVMTDEVLRLLVLNEEGLYVDCTLGDGGHAAAICRRLKGKGRLLGLDWDEEALTRAKKRLKACEDKILFKQSSYTDLENVLSKMDLGAVDGVLIDLGASTLQLLDPKRGFSMHGDSDLDMRMDQKSSLTAKEIVATYSKEELANLFYRYGEERFSKRIAARLVAHREKKGPIEKADELAELVKEAIPARFRRQGRHPARKVFQALRLAVNSELENIELVLPQALNILKPGGRLCVISYHSLEDRLVKHFYRDEAQGCKCPTNLPCICNDVARLKIITAKAVRPSPGEVEQNPRARSARMRVAEKRKTA